MANLESIINTKSQNDEQWRQQRQEARDYVIATRDGGIMNVTANPQLYEQYLMLQGDNPSYSAGNIVLCIYQLTDPTVIGTAEKWKSAGRYVVDRERNKGAKIFVRPSNPNIKGYNVGMAYDISQTEGKALATVKLRDESPQMDKALAALLNYSPVEIVADKTLDMPALYHDGEMTLFVNPDTPDSKAFAGIATEIALARMHGKGYNSYYNRDECMLAADSVSYLMCRRFGIDRELPDLSNLANMYDGLSVESRTSGLNQTQDMAKQIGNNIERQINPPQRNMSRPAARAAR